jgi:hypothetical protein
MYVVGKVKGVLRGKDGEGRTVASVVSRWKVVRLGRARVERRVFMVGV